MTVCEAEQDMQVKANTIYVIPPNCDMVYNEGKIGLSVRNRDTSHPLPIDIFFTSLAKELKKNAIGIVLSGTGSDGTIGLGKILDGGGMTIAQEPGSAEFSAMPLSAILAGVVKYTMPIKNMASHLYELSTLGYINSQKAETYHEGESSQFDKALLLLKDGTGHDFYDYKQSTLLRRLKKRMKDNQINTIAEYIDYAKDRTDEINILYNEMLIGVTSFFRDAEVFSQITSTVVPKIMKMNELSKSVRVWCPGCSTGEEAYSYAIIIKEYLTQHNLDYDVKIFATDIDGDSIEKARNGLFRKQIKEKVSEERLARFFYI